ncbi:carbonic anhydrase [Mycena rosella]|uniref:Carbonic anhydrase n=1 Tax=Mycena rosella TaxID=1033263 RepID=A0AAD7DKP1_MYCRO|nr:carbonic anhydrase [Mycena rosella]
MFLHKIPKVARPPNVLVAPSHYRAHSFVAPRHKRVQETAEEPLPVPKALPPAKRLAISMCPILGCRVAQVQTLVTCMDARINPFSQLDISEGDAHIIRNAGGMAKDALRSLIISQRLLGTREIAVYHHTGCGMVTFRGSELKRLVKWADPDNISCAEQVDKIDFLEFNDLEESVKSDVNFLKESPLILKGTKITGWIHDIDTGEATRVI